MQKCCLLRSEEAAQIVSRLTTVAAILHVHTLVEGGLGRVLDDARGL
jgi:hypothetical protein